MLPETKKKIKLFNFTLKQSHTYRQTLRWEAICRNRVHSYSHLRHTRICTHFLPYTQAHIHTHRHAHTRTYAQPHTDLHILPRAHARSAVVIVAVFLIVSLINIYYVNKMRMLRSIKYEISEVLLKKKKNHDCRNYRRLLKEKISWKKTRILKKKWDNWETRFDIGKTRLLRKKRLLFFFLAFVFFAFFCWLSSDDFTHLRNVEFQTDTHTHTILICFLTAQTHVWPRVF